MVELLERLPAVGQGRVRALVLRQGLQLLCLCDLRG